MTPDLIRPLKRHLYAFAFVDEFGPLYAMYPLLFADCGLTTAQISTVFMLWAAVGVVAEVPSGALADRVDRRRLMAFALGLRAVGILVWVLWPTFIGILVGATLWSIHSALASGAWEALVYDELATVGASDDYPIVMARIGQCSHLGVACGIGVATGLVALGWSLPALAVITVGVHLPSIVLVLELPRTEQGEQGEQGEDPVTFADWWATLREGALVTVRARSLTKLVILGAVLEGLFILDEYVHLLARHRGADDETVPILVLCVWLGVLAGGEIAARLPKLSPLALGGALGLGTSAAAMGLLLGNVVGLALLGVAYATLQTTWVLADARFQAQMPSDTRATVTSVRAFFSNLVSIAAFAIIGAVAIDGDPTPGLLGALAILLVAAAWVPRWVPAASASSTVMGEPTPTR